jgi:hypothetical protein
MCRQILRRHNSSATCLNGFVLILLFTPTPPRGVFTRFLRDKTKAIRIIAWMPCAKPLFCGFCAWVVVNGVNSNVWIVYHVIGHMNSLVIFCFLCYINNGDRAIALSFFYINRKLCLGWRCRLQHFLILLLPERLLFVLPTRKVFALHYYEKKKFVKRRK